MSTIKKHKTLGQVYTPVWIVSEILDNVGYKGNHILKKYIFEPACGDGAFLQEIVKRYICASAEKGYSQSEIIKDLETFIVAIEIDETAYKSCLNRLNKIVSDFMAQEIKLNWQIYNDNTLHRYKDFKNYFDFVVGNPPYIRIHNLDMETRKLLKQKFLFAVGTIDIYISFFEIAFFVIKPNGQIGYITPNSFLHNASYKTFRSFLQAQKHLKTLIDFKSHKVFEGFSTYTAISIFSELPNRDYFIYKEMREGQIKEVNQIAFDELTPQKWNLTDSNSELFLEDLFKNKNTMLKDFFDVQYGFATLRDKIFIGKVQEFDAENFLFNGHLVEKEILKKIVKGSRYKGGVNEIEYILFPYSYNGKKYQALPEEVLKKHLPNAYKYLLLNKQELEKRDLDKGVAWFEFGRSQGIQTIHKEKIILSTLANDKINYHKIDKDTMLYSGIFITKKHPNTPWDLIENVLTSEDFFRYIRITGKDFSSGYKSISTKQIKEYRVDYNNPETLF